MVEMEVLWWRIGLFEGKEAMQLIFVRCWQQGRTELEWIFDATRANQGPPGPCPLLKKLTFGLSGLDYTSEQDSDHNLSVHIILQPGLRV